MACSILGNKNGGKVNSLHEYGSLRMQIVNAAPSVEAVLNFSCLHVLQFYMLSTLLLLLY